MKVGQVIYIDFPHPSFKWANGLKVIVSKTENTIDMVDISKEGKINTFSDGKYIKGTTGINNTGIRVIEGLTYKVNKKLL